MELVIFIWFTVLSWKLSNVNNKLNKIIDKQKEHDKTLMNLHAKQYRDTSKIVSSVEEAMTEESERIYNALEEYYKDKERHKL